MDEDMEQARSLPWATSEKTFMLGRRLRTASQLEERTMSPELQFLLTSRVNLGGE